MLQEERFIRINALLATHTRISTERIALDLDVSRETVRRDVLELEARGKLRRVHGGVVATGPEPEAPFAVRMRVNAREKHAIAKAALGLLSPGQTLFLDAGSTTGILAEELASMTGLTIVTNAVRIAARMSGPHGTRSAGNDAILLGGRIDADVNATYGDLTINEIGRYQADVALLSPVGLTAQQGATSYEHHEAAVAQAMARHARHVVILADHSKIGVRSRVSYAEAGDIDTVVSNSQGSSEAELTALRRCGVDVLLA
jgi:DeoR/GlpR family transcriptional regulator of sugar metabolism